MSAGKRNYENRGIVVVPAEVVMHRCKGGLTLLDQKLFRYLLNRAQRRLDAQVHEIEAKDARDFLETDPLTLVDSLRRLGEVSIEISYNRHGEQHVPHMQFLSLDCSRTRDGTLTYAFDPLLLPFLKDPRIYTRIFIHELREFSTRGALRLYEVMKLYDGRRHDRTWVVQVDELKTVLGCEPSMTFKNFNARVLRPAIEEINERTPLQIEVDYIKTGARHVVESVRLRLVDEHRDFLTPPPFSVRAKRDEDIWATVERERRAVLEIGDETRGQAERMVSGTGLDVGELERAWREQMTGRLVRNPNENFKDWIRLKVGQQNDPEMKDVDDEAFGDFLEGRRWRRRSGKY